MPVEEGSRSPQTALSLFPEEDPRGGSRPATDGEALEILESDFAAWERICRRAERRPGPGRERIRLDALGRDLRAVRDCYLASRHPLVRRALLQEADALARRMSACEKRLRRAGFEIRPLGR